MNPNEEKANLDEFIKYAILLPSHERAEALKQKKLERMWSFENFGVLFRGELFKETYTNGSDFRSDKEKISGYGSYLTRFCMYSPNKEDVAKARELLPKYR